MLSGMAFFLKKIKNSFLKNKIMFSLNNYAKN